MKKFVCFAVAMMFVGAASGQSVRVIQAEDAVILRTNYVIMADTNVPPYAYNTNYITPLDIGNVAHPTPTLFTNWTIYAVGDLASNAGYNLYLRVHVGTNAYTDDSIFLSRDGFGTNIIENTYQNGIAGRTGLDGQLSTADGFHWIRMNGTGDLGWQGPFNTGAGTNLYFAIAPREDGLDVDALAFVIDGLPVTDEMLDPANSNVALWVAGFMPDAPVTDTTPLLEAYFADGSETVNTNAVTFTVDGSPVTNLTFSYTNATTTVGYTPSSPFDAPSTHTAKVVAASAPSGILVTNEWTFDVLAYPIRYVDASATNTIMATSTNGPVGAGTALVTVTDSLADGLWRFRNGFGVAPSETNGPSGTISLSTTNTILESHDWAATDNVPRLKTSVSGLGDYTYAVFVYFWDDGNGWCIRAGLQDTPGTNSLEYIDAASTNVVAVGDDGARTLYRAFLGYVKGTAIDVFVEDLPGTDSNDRVWYDGIGYQQTDGPTVDPDIQGLTIAAGTVTITWISEAQGTYSIMHKTNVTDSVWSPVKTGIAGGDPTTSDSVSVSGADKEFFQIKGE